LEPRYLFETRHFVLILLFVLILSICVYLFK